MQRAELIFTSDGSNTREDVRGVAGVAAATPFFQVLFHKLGPKIKKKIL